MMKSFVCIYEEFFWGGGMFRSIDAYLHIFFIPVKNCCQWFVRSDHNTLLFMLFEIIVSLKNTNLLCKQWFNLKPNFF